MHKFAFAILVIAASTACKSSTATDPPSAPAPAPKAPDKVPAKPAEPAPAVLQIQGANTFTGLSKDGKRFAWLAPSTAGIMWLKIAELGKSEPVLTHVDKADDPAIKAKLADFSPDRKPAGPDVVLGGTITASPPTLVVTRGDKSVTVPIGKYPFEPTDAAEIWGTSADGKYLAIHIAGKDVPGLLSKGGGADFQSFFVVAAP